MTKFQLLAASTLMVGTSHLATAQVLSSGTSTSTPRAEKPAASATASSVIPSADESDPQSEVVVTAQRQSQRLQDVPIAVSAFDARALDRQQIKNPLDLQLTLPNVQLTKTNFTSSSSFTIRGIGDLCVGTTCDAATAIHLNDEPLFASPFIQTEFYDIGQIEVLRGPQGTLFGRNATAGVVNIVSARPDLNATHAAIEGEYGNYASYKVKGMINIPLTNSLGFRVAGLYLNRDGFTKNLYDNSRIDDRDLYSVRGTLRFQPSADTTIDLIGSYFKEDDNRLRVQKQYCQRDPTGVLGCLPGRLDNGSVNTNGTFTGTLTSREFLAIQGIPAAFGLGSLYGPDGNSGVINPADSRTVIHDTTPTFKTSELIIQGKLRQRVGRLNVALSGTYQDTNTNSSRDYLGSVISRTTSQPGYNVLAAAAAGAIPGLPAAYFAPIAAALIPNGPAGVICTSLPDATGTGVYGGKRRCADTLLDFDRSNNRSRAYSVEGIVNSDFSGPFNFLVGGIYSDLNNRDNNYNVDTSSIDYLSGLLGSFTALGNRAANGTPAPLPPAYLATPYSAVSTDRYLLKSYGFFGEAYLNLGSKLKLTGGLRYNHDSKRVVARNTLASFLAPYGIANAFDSPYFGAFDADPGIAGNQPLQVRSVSFGELTGRGVVDFQISRDSLLYASYSRGYKSGGINPPLSPVFAVNEAFNPEFINAYEIGSKNTFGNGALTLNLTGFYYSYKDLQLSRIIARTAVNDNVNANIYGVEAEAVLRPTRRLAVNLGASYLHTKVSSDKFLSNPRDPSGGRADAVIIKDLSNGSNCAITSNVGSAVAAQGFVTAVNSALGLRGPTGFGANSGLAATGAFGICSVLQSSAGSPAAAALGGFTLQPAGVAVNIRGNDLPQAPRAKFNVGVQYTAEYKQLTIVPRVDLTYTSEFYAGIFNLPIDRVKGYTQINAQVQFNGPDDRFFVRGFIQNVGNNNAITGQFVADASSGLYTNTFTLEPRRYGIAAGVKF